MQHLDEGTVHAWIDGALPPDESERVAVHVSTCAPCAALVAEARGLIAAASRILTALDDVPGGVIPAAPSSSGGVAPIAHSRPSGTTGPRRWLRVTSNHWRVAAAIAFLAGTSVLVSRVDRDEAPGTSSVESVAFDVAPESGVRGPADGGDGMSRTGGSDEKSAGVAAPANAGAVERASRKAVDQSAADVAGALATEDEQGKRAANAQLKPVARPSSAMARAGTPSMGVQNSPARSTSPTRAPEPTAPAPPLAQMDARPTPTAPSAKSRGLSSVAAAAQRLEIEESRSSVRSPDADALRRGARDSAADASTKRLRAEGPGTIGDAFGTSAAAESRTENVALPPCYRLSLSAWSPVLSASALAAVRRIPTQVRLDSVPAGPRDADRYRVRALAPVSAGTVMDGEWTADADEALLEWVVEGTSISMWFATNSGSPVAGTVEVTTGERTATGRVTAQRRLCP